jgi:hypothetical protein
MRMTKTGVFATPEQREKLQKMTDEARRTPVILVGGVDVAGNAWSLVQRACHAAALENGLPEIPGFYGMTEEGEFVKT